METKGDKRRQEEREGDRQISAGQEEETGDNKKETVDLCVFNCLTFV